MYSLVSRPRIARVLCFLRWTEQIAYLSFYFNLSKKNCNMFARLVGHHPHHVLLDCLLICYFVMLPPTVFMYNLFFFISRFQTIFSPFFALWILLASQPRLARVSCFIRRAERTRSPIGIHGCISTGRFVLITDSFCYSFLQGVFLQTACSSC